MASIVKARIGLSKFTLGLFGGFLVGIFLGDYFKLPFYYFLILAMVIVAGTVFVKKRNIYLLILISLSGILFGLALYRNFDQKEDAKTLQYNQSITIEGIVKQTENKEKYQQVIVSNRNTKILIQAPLYPQYQYGDFIKIENVKIQNPSELKLTAGVNDFDYGNYLLKHGIRGLVKNPEKIEKIGWQGNKIIAAILIIGTKFQTVINQLLPEPMSTLMIGTLIGLKQELPDSITTAFQRTGLSHITAVSGYNVTIIIIWISFLLMIVSRRASFFGAILATVIFIILTGASASVIRAGALAILVISAKFIGRRPYYPILILLAADLMLIFNPYALKNDISFQLSFLAFIGLLILANPVAEIKYFKMIPENVRKIFAETLSAQIMVLPILIYNFGLVSIIAPVANILILPIIPLIMFIGFFTGIIGIISLKVGQIISLLSFVILKYILIVVENLSHFSWAAVSVKTNQWWWIPIYYLLLLVCLKKKPATN